MTGYYEPELRAFHKKGKNRYPIYQNPDKFKMYDLSQSTRKEINDGALKEKGLEIAWVENEVEAFFLHVQGSGRLKFNNGEVIKVRYAGSNDKAYTSIGKVLFDSDKIKEDNISMYTIKNWLYKNKREARKVMEKNKRYIYFEKYEGSIKGSSSVTLKPKISVAVDPNFHQPGTIFIIKKVNEKTR